MIHVHILIDFEGNISVRIELNRSLGADSASPFLFLILTELSLRNEVPHELSGCWLLQQPLLGDSLTWSHSWESAG